MSINKRQMKTICIVLCFSLLSTSCTKEEEEIQKTNPRTLLNIEYKDGERPRDNYMELYAYDVNGKLATVENRRLFGTRYQMEYNNNKLQQYTTTIIEDNALIARDSMAYNENGTIRAIYNFPINVEGNLSLRRIYEFEYSDQNVVSSKTTRFLGNVEFTSFNKYFWDNGNITKVERYDGAEVLQDENFLIYDDKVNYKKGIPIFIFDPINWSENNITKSTYKDYTGLLDPICNPCVTEYNYNVDNYPVFIKQEWGRELSLTYE